MNCSEVQERLSAFVDNELSASQREQVGGHLQACPGCAESVALAKSLSRQTRSLADPTPPPGLWEGIESALRQESVPPLYRTGQQAKRWTLSRRSWALAASILVLIGAGVWTSHGLWGEHGHESMAANFDVYLAKYSVDPEQAHQTLVAAYDGQSVTPAEVKKQFGYQPLNLEGRAGMTVEQMYALDMPCCQCTLAVCRRPDGGVVTVMEHLEPQPTWFGDRSRIECLCDGKPTSIVQVNGQLAASWREGKRHVTIIGARDLEEVTQMVAGFNQSPNG